MTVSESARSCESLLPLQAYTSENREILIEAISPEIDGGRYPAKRVVGDLLEVQADIFREGHDQIAAVLAYRQISGVASTDTEWHEVPMHQLVNDRWSGQFLLTSLGTCCYRIEAWNDRFGTWRRDMEKRVQAGLVAESDVLEGIA